MTAKMSKAATRYETLQAAARQINHEVRIVIISGALTEPRDVVMVPMNGIVGLDDAMSLIEEYVGTDEAKEHGRLIGDVIAAETQADEAALVAELAAIRVHRARRALDRRTAQSLAGREPAEEPIADLV